MRSATPSPTAAADSCRRAGSGERPAGRSLPELDELERVIELGGARLEVRVACEIATPGASYPVHVIALGNPDPDAPAFGVFGGVHGLERIGSVIAIAWLRSLVVRLGWDSTLQHLLESARLVFMPLINPGGFALGTRANPQGVDLMRNAPVHCDERPAFLLGGQRIGRWLPWYRGAEGAPMEVESQAVCEVIERELLTHRFALTVDCHSGFGLEDRIWFPHAHTRRPVPHLPELLALCELLDATHPQHRYLFEPQSRQYLAHGDLWDHLYLRALASPGRVLLPLTLEMGSWIWVKKNPLQMLSRNGIFNPLIEHRRKRTIRRHTVLLDFLMRAAASRNAWLPEPGARASAHQRALSRWYVRE